MVMHRLLAQQIRQDEPLPWNIYDISSNLLLRKGFILDKHIHLPDLIERGMYVELSSIKVSLDNEGRNKHQFDPWRLWEDIQVRLGQVLKKPATDGKFSEQVQELADLVRLLSERSADVALAAIMLMEQGRYPVTHSLHCAVVAELVAKRLEWSTQERQSLCCAALTMNIAMLDLQHTLCNQATPLTPEQQQAVKSHPEQGFRILHTLGVRDSAWLQTVMEHHEQLDGKGYPRGLDTPSPSALLLRTVDIFCAKVSPRAHRKPMLASEASRLMFTVEGRHENNPFPACLIKQVGIYPPGSFVKLGNGETGVVFKRGENANTPIVYSLINETGHGIATPIKRDTSQSPFQVLAVIPRCNMMLKFDPRVIWKTASQ
ncbi:HD domain-containing protein [Limnobacter thiooxidans]|uniref:HD-GYP domain-containing protein n=1 Tax=Limnobacter thiooxidans TaxID=131080 RepID=A0AA86MDZ8_9BURK|nr:HD domain-containing protein [Limnobacter thiooxidans]BET26456.1 hypothetical protein RGQ30_19570 [Limnobacter thiooxidans]